jgi:hypothetical protein
MGGYCSMSGAGRETSPRAPARCATHARGAIAADEKEGPRPKARPVELESLKTS